jgi:CRP/FNR family transcriptional regulator, anaerobic regulatory protein
MDNRRKQEMKASALMLDNPENASLPAAGVDFSRNPERLADHFPEPQTPCENCACRDRCLGADLAAAGNSLPYKSLIHSYSLAPNKHIFRQGEKSEALYIVRAGAVKLYCVSASGKEQVLVFHMPGEVLGLDALGVDSYDSSALTLEYTSLCVIPFTSLKLIPDSHHYLYKLLSSAVVRDHRTIELIARKDAEAKLAIFLLDISKRFHVRGCSASDFNLSMKRSEIGNHLGLAVETVSRLFTRFQQDGLLQVNKRQISILDFARLERLAGMRIQT